MKKSMKSLMFQATVCHVLDANPNLTPTMYAMQMGVNRFYMYKLLKDACNNDMVKYRNYLERPEISEANTGKTRHYSIRIISKTTNCVDEVEIKDEAEEDIIGQIEAEIVILETEAEAIFNYFR